jgi:adenosylmethionine-8-amino-7-oxononanoate aminotransferase
MGNQDYVQRDLSVVWRPCTPMKEHEGLSIIPIRRGDAVWLEDFDGKHCRDAISSWWVNLFGHRNPHITAALQEQLDSRAACAPGRSVVDCVSVSYGMPNGVLPRAPGNAVDFMPPCVITEPHIQTMTKVAWEAVLRAAQA